MPWVSNHEHKIEQNFLKKFPVLLQLQADWLAVIWNTANMDQIKSQYG